MRSVQTFRRGRELDLDVVRGVAILLAVSWHFRPRSSVPVLDALLWPGRSFGWAGVDLFFVLSGFLVGRIILSEIAEKGRFDGGRFLRRRAFKLWPVLYVFLLLQVCFGDNGWRTFLVQNVFHVQNYTGTSLNHLWSLAVEEHFYLAIALASPWLARIATRPACLLVAVSGFLLVPLVLRIAASLSGASVVTLQWQTQFRVDALTAGVVLAVLYVHYPAFFAQLRSWTPLWAAGTVIGVVLLGGGLFGDLHSTPSAAALGYTVAYLTSVSFLLLVYGMRRATWINKALLPLAYLGVYSYGIYIWHEAAAVVAERALARFATAVPGSADLVTSPGALTASQYACAFGVGVMSTVLVEWPCLRLRERLVASPVRVPPLAAAAVPRPRRAAMRGSLR